MKVLYNRLIRSETSIGGNLSSMELYSITVSGIRACLKDKLLANIAMTDKEWGDAHDYGKKRKTQKTKGGNRE